MPYYDILTGQYDISTMLPVNAF